jgi:hypothetical protein
VNGTVIIALRCVLVELPGLDHHYDL